MNYLTLAIPEDLKNIANKISVAFEPDPAINPDTYDSFLVQCTDQNSNDYVAYGSEVNQFIYENYEVWKSDYTLLHNIVKKSYSDRSFNGCPTKTQCKTFCENILVSKQYGVYSGLQELGLVIKTSIE